MTPFLSFCPELYWHEGQSGYKSSKRGFPMVFPVPNCILQDSETLLITNSLHPCLSRSVHRSRGLLVRIPAVSYTHVIRRKVCLRSDMGTGRFHIGHFLRSFLNYKKLVSEFVLFFTLLLLYILLLLEIIGNNTVHQFQISVEENLGACT